MTLLSGERSLEQSKKKPFVLCKMMLLNKWKPIQEPFIKSKQIKKYTLFLEL